jgi:intracellular septation protein
MKRGWSAFADFLASFGPALVFLVVFGLAGHQPEATTYLVNAQVSWFGSGPVAADHAPLVLAGVAAGLVFVLQMLVLGLQQRRPDAMPLVNVSLVLVFGGASLWFSPETFQRWQPSVLYWTLGMAIWLTQLLAGRNVLRLLLAHQLSLSARRWHRLNFAWVAFFAMMGLLHLWGAYSLGPTAWGLLKTFGGLGLVALFVLAQAGLLGLDIRNKLRTNLRNSNPRQHTP